MVQYTTHCAVATVDKNDKKLPEKQRDSCEETNLFNAVQKFLDDNIRIVKVSVLNNNLLHVKQFMATYKLTQDGYSRYQYMFRMCIFFFSECELGYWRYWSYCYYQENLRCETFFY